MQPSPFPSLVALGACQFFTLGKILTFPIYLYFSLCVCGLTTRPRSCFLSRSLFLFLWRKDWLDANFNFFFFGIDGEKLLEMWWCWSMGKSICLLLLGDMLQGDASVPIGTRMVLSFNNNNNKHKSSHDDDDHPLVSADLLSMVELLLKEIVGGMALGWEQHGPSVQ